MFGTHLATIDRLCSRHPAGRQQIAELRRAEFWDDDGTAREAALDQYEAERTGLLPLLAPRWGEAQRIGLQGMELRAGEGEPIPDPWPDLGALLREAHLWRAGDRWLLLGVTHGDGQALLRLLAVTTTVDPP